MVSVITSIVGNKSQESNFAKPGSHTYQDCYNSLRNYWDDIYPNCTNNAIDTQQKLTICTEKIRILREKMANGCRDCK